MSVECDAANAQSGVMSRKQLLALGYTDEFIENQLLARRWQQVYRASTPPSRAHCRLPAGSRPRYYE
jgi:hypothetical protein